MAEHSPTTESVFAESPGDAGSSWSRAGSRPFASPLFRRLAGRGACFHGFPIRWVLHFALSLTRSITVHDATPYSREDPVYECGRRDNLSCLFYTGLWLRQSQSILVQEIQRTKDIDLTCYRTLPTKATACLQVMRIPTTNTQKALFQLPHTPLEAGCSPTTSGTA